MGIIIRFLFKNILDKKLRTFLIVLSIIISSAVFFASLAISGSLMKMFTSTITEFIGNADLVVTATEKSPTRFMNIEKAKQFVEKLEYAFGQLEGGASFNPRGNEEVNVSIKGTDLEDLQKMNPFTITQESSLQPFEGRKIIISEDAAKKYDLKLNDSIKLKFNSNAELFSICAIAKPAGPFKTQGSNYINAIVPKTTLGGIMNAKGKANVIYIKLKNPLDKQEMIKKLSEEYNRYRVAEAFPFEQLQTMAAGVSVVFIALSSVVFFMSIFIIYSSFKVITIERLPMIGTFRSIGATRKMTDLLLLGESIAYGVLGGIGGCSLGIGILYFMSNTFSKMVTGDSNVEFKTTLEFSGMHFVLTFLVAIFLCFISSIFPIIKVMKIPVKDIILNNVQKVKKRGRIRLILGIVFIGIAFLYSIPDSEMLRPICGGLGMIFSLISLILLVPYVTRLLVKLFEKIYDLAFGNVGILAAKNLRENNSILNNISMLAIGMSSLLMINTAGYSSATELVSNFQKQNYDIRMFVWNADKNKRNHILKVDGVKDIYNEITTEQLEVVGNPNKINISSVDKTKFLEYWTMKKSEITQELLEELDAERSILLNKYAKNVFNLKKGDFIKIKMKSGEKSYKVLGFFSDAPFYSLVSEKYLKSDMQLQNYSSFYIKTFKSPEEVKEAIKQEFKKLDPYIETKTEAQQKSEKSNQQGMALLSGFGVLAMFIGIFGVINNLLISFIERKFSLAVLKSMGMSKIQSIQMIFIEAFTGGLVGGMLGVAGGSVMICVLVGLNSIPDIKFPVGTFAAYMIAGAVIMLVSSISPALKTSKLDIVSTIKFE
ncbi:MAG: ABC transporter permease [Clostridia bacterium]|nr:ABC transporter permease [Clostridia bacterium]